MSDKNQDYQASSFKNYDFDLFTTGSTGNDISSSSRRSTRSSQSASRSTGESRDLRSNSAARSSAGRRRTARDVNLGSGTRNTRSTRGSSHNSGSHHRKRRSKKMSTLWRVIISLALVVSITALLVVGVFAVYVFAFVDGTLDYDLYDLKIDYNTTIYAPKDDGSGEYYELDTVHGNENRVWVDYGDCSPYVFQAIIAAEDNTFETHGGINWKRTFGAFANYFLHFWDTEQGGSTITQQLVKNITGDADHGAMRKIREIMRARYVEHQYDKDVILECYTNVIHYGNGCDGIQTAAKYYFNKDAKDLTLVEAASLAATIKSPTGYNPKGNPQNNKTRRNWVLAQMLDLDYITEEQYDAACKQEITVYTGKAATNAHINSYYVDYVVESVVAALMEEEGCSRAAALSMINSDGLKIYTTYSERVQKAIDAVYADSSNFLRKKNIKEDPQSGFVVMDYSGHVLGVMGGYGEKKGNLVLNRATQTVRPIGSTIKPLAAYSPAIETNLATWSTIIEDAPITLADGTKWPRNSTGTYKGNTFLYDGLRRSVNTIAVRLVQKLTPQVSFDYCSGKYGLTTLVASRTNSNGKIATDVALGPMGIGSLTDGAKVVEMCAAYATFGNLGQYYKPTCITKVTSKSGAVLFEYDSPAQFAIGEDTASVMNKLLQNVIKSGTATRGAISGWELYGKTGTTSDTKDLWFCGGSPYYVAACWYGYDTPAKMNGLAMNPALKVWRAVMAKLHEGLTKKQFRVSSDVSYRYYCKETGLLATDACTDCALGWYKDSSLPAACTTHPGNPLKEQYSGAKAYTKDDQGHATENTSSETPEEEPNNGF